MGDKRVCDGSDAAGLEGLGRPSGGLQVARAWVSCTVSQKQVTSGRQGHCVQLAGGDWAACCRLSASFELRKGRFWNASPVYTNFSRHESSTDTSSNMYHSGMQHNSMHACNSTMHRTQKLLLQFLWRTQEQQHALYHRSMHHGSMHKGSMLQHR